MSGADVDGEVVDLLTRFYAHHRAVVGSRSPGQLKALAARIASQGIEGPAGELEKKYGISLIAFRDLETGGGNAPAPAKPSRPSKRPPGSRRNTAPSSSAPPAKPSTKPPSRRPSRPPSKPPARSASVSLAKPTAHVKAKAKAVTEATPREGDGAPGESTSVPPPVAAAATLRPAAERSAPGTPPSASKPAGAGAHLSFEELLRDSLDQVEKLSGKELVGLAAMIGAELSTAGDDRIAMIAAIKASLVSDGGDQKKLDTMRQRLSVVATGKDDVEVGPRYGTRSARPVRPAAALRQAACRRVRPCAHCLLLYLPVLGLVCVVTRYLC